MTAPTFTLSAHATEMLAVRAIDPSWIARTLAEPDNRHIDWEDPSLHHALRAIRERDGRVLRVVYNPNVEPWRVITVFFDRSQRRRA